MNELLADRYELGPVLGIGGMARVVRAHDRMLDRRVAVKLLRDDQLVVPSARERFLAEARAAASFSHPHAVAVYDIGRDGGVSFIVMELVDGQSLAEVLAERGALEQDEAVAVACQVLSALDAAHARGLVHRDVKPANILLPGGRVPRLIDDPGGAKLADFGIAKATRDAAAGLTVDGQVMGTPKYLSPEQVIGQAATPESDLYSTGVVLYEMLAGHAPFDGDNPIAIAMAHREDPPPRLDRLRRGLDPSLVGTVHKALEKTPMDRFPGAADMRDALRLGTGPPPPPEVAPTQVLQDQPPVMRRAAAQPAQAGHPWRMIIIVGALALAALVGVVAYRALPDLLAREQPGGTPPATAPAAAGDDEGTAPAASQPEDPQVTQAPQATQAPEPTAEPPAPTGAVSPTEAADVPSIPEILARLAVNPGSAGERGGELRSALVELVDQAAADRAQAAADLSDQVESWAEAGELDRTFADGVIRALERLAS